MVALGTQPSYLARKADELGEDEQVRPLLDVAPLEDTPPFVEEVLPMISGDVLLMLVVVSCVVLKVVDIFEVARTLVSLP